uniref:Replication protein A C-terminal domain-containing protein n=1 Tax=Alexandrium monilatum TaxID=311494 RepID=A0A7S4RSY7_9DINO|mmetsp:Transcript_46318/g.138478  ORF Transcript_46318/g.138478 Transcript_46318/m.138478 type:complete len:277 (+) Transcript_46318:75-905(+)
MLGGVQSFGPVSDAFGAAVGTQAAPAATQDPGARRARQEERQTCLPVTVRMIGAAAERREGGAGEGLRFHGSEHGVLILVGLVESLARQAASTELTVSDGTGRIKARCYSGGEHLQGLALGSYVSLFGSVRTAPELHFAALGVSAVESADEVSFHMIEVAHAALKLGGASPDLTTPPPKKPAPRSAGLPEPASAGFDGLSAASPPKTAPLASKPLRTAILEFLRTEGEERPEGVGLTAICSCLGGTPAGEVAKVLEGLVGDGDVFTTIDDEHFQCV